MSFRLWISWQHRKSPSFLLLNNLYWQCLCYSPVLRTGGNVFFQIARNVLAVWVKSQLGDHYNAGDECSALARGMRLLSLICFYKEADTIEDWRRMKVVLPIWAATLSFVDKETNHPNLWASRQGPDVRSVHTNAPDPQLRYPFFLLSDCH